MLKHQKSKISGGQLNHLLIGEKEKFHLEKKDLLSAGLQVSRYIHVDDTVMSGNIRP